MLYYCFSSLIDKLVFPAPKTSACDFYSPHLRGIEDGAPYLLIDSPNPRAICLYFHGNAETIDDNEGPLLELAKKLNVSIIAPEYPGYGRASGVASHKKVVETATAFTKKAFEFAARGATKLPVIVIGRSIGTGAACHVASTAGDPIAALMLISPFTSISDIASEYFPGAWIILKGYHFDNIRALKKFGRPLLLQHGQQDTIVPHAHSERIKLFMEKRTVPNFTLKSYEAGHNDIDLSEVASDMDSFLKTVGI
ncbi:Alpha/Beta hydrolase protein [Gaertneriomyces semiglobifer]|nr:Alpha/Beta hydrolase protein [Gaertneriomyces semiglobifer]